MDGCKGGWKEVGMKDGGMKGWKEGGMEGRMDGKMEG